MDNGLLPFERETIRIYYYYFEGIDDPLMIEANDKKQADQFLIDNLQVRGWLGKVKLIDYRVTTPIFGVTEKEGNYIWAGFDYCKEGWMTKEEFAKLKIKDD